MSYSRAYSSTVNSDAKCIYETLILPTAGQEVVPREGEGLSVGSHKRAKKTEIGGDLNLAYAKVFGKLGIRSSRTTQLYLYLDLGSMRTAQPRNHV